MSEDLVRAELELCAPAANRPLRLSSINFISRSRYGETKLQKFESMKSRSKFLS